MINSGLDKTDELFKMGRHCLVSGKPFESLRFYAKAIQASSTEHAMTTALDSIDTLIAAQPQQLENRWVRNLLLTGLAAKFPSTKGGKSALKQVKNLATTSIEPFKNPVVVVAGGCSAEVETQMRQYKNTVVEAFRSFNGTVISGGTTSGVSGLVGEAQQIYPTAIKTIGYVPRRTKNAMIDKRYTEIRFTEGDNFSPTEPLQYWLDIFASGIRSGDVKLLGINGGRISAIEYRMAIAFGAQVAIIRESGMEANNLLSDDDWNTLKNLVILSNSSEMVQTFLLKRK